MKRILFKFLFIFPVSQLGVRHNALCNNMSTIPCFFLYYFLLLLHFYSRVIITVLVTEPSRLPQVYCWGKNRLHVKEHTAQAHVGEQRGKHPVKVMYIFIFRMHCLEHRKTMSCIVKIVNYNFKTQFHFNGSYHRVSAQ